LHFSYFAIDMPDGQLMIGLRGEGKWLSLFLILFITFWIFLVIFFSDLMKN